MTVNNWLKRYQAEDFERVKAQVKVSRQRISAARAELEASLAKGFSLSTLKRFLKKTIAASNELEND